MTIFLFCERAGLRDVLLADIVPTKNYYPENTQHPDLPEAGSILANVDVEIRLKQFGPM